MLKNEIETSLSLNSDLVRNIGTPCYTSEEVLRRKLITLDQMSDKFGLVVFEIVLKEEPSAT